VTVQSLEEMIRLLEDPDGGGATVEEVVETQQDDDDASDAFFHPLPCTVEASRALLAADEAATSQPEGRVLVLGPDHPRMQRFQAALKRHLQKQIYLEECQLRDLVSLYSRGIFVSMRGTTGSGQSSIP